LTAVDNENDLPSKVTGVMSTLDEVKKYKELARSLVDFALIILGSVVAILFVYIGFNLYLASGGMIPPNYILSGIESIISLFVAGGAFVIGTLWVGRRASKVKTGEWKKELEQENEIVGAMKILSGLDWPGVFQDIKYSKIGFVFYGILKVLGYWILVSIIVLLASTFGLSALHVTETVLSLYILAVFSLVIAAVLSRKDLQRRYNQSWALDSLLWELRWFDNEFRRKASELGSTATAAKA
jgi:hypothetical protein